MLSIFFVNYTAAVPIIGLLYLLVLVKLFSGLFALISLHPLRNVQVWFTRPID